MLRSICINRMTENKKINATYRQVFIRGWVAAAADGVADVSGVAKRCIANGTLLMGEYIRVLINIAGVLSWKGWVSSDDAAVAVWDVKIFYAGGNTAQIRETAAKFLIKKSDFNNKNK